MRVAEQYRDDRGSPVRMFEDEPGTQPFAQVVPSPSFANRPVVPVLRRAARKGRRTWGRLSLLTFFGEAKKVSCRRATPGTSAGSKKKYTNHTSPSSPSISGQTEIFRYKNCQTRHHAMRCRIDCQTPDPAPLPGQKCLKTRPNAGLSSPKSRHPPAVIFRFNPEEQQ